MVLLASEYDKSRFLKSEDLDKERKFRIKTVTEEEVGTGAEKEKKLVVWFTNDPRGLVLNKTNNRTLRNAYGDDVTGWTGKVVMMFTVMTDNRGKIVPGLRVRILPPKQPAAAAVPPQQPANTEWLPGQDSNQRPTG
jgi:hypothetical protein